MGYGFARRHFCVACWAEKGNGGGVTSRTACTRPQASEISKREGDDPVGPSVFWKNGWLVCFVEGFGGSSGGARGPDFFASGHKESRCGAFLSLLFWCVLCDDTTWQSNDRRRCRCGRRWKGVREQGNFRAYFVETMVSESGPRGRTARRRDM